MAKPFFQSFLPAEIIYFINHGFKLIQHRKSRFLYSLSSFPLKSLLYRLLENNFEIFRNKKNYCRKTLAISVCLYGIVKRTYLSGRFDIRIKSPNFLFLLPNPKRPAFFDRSHNLNEQSPE